MMHAKRGIPLANPIHNTWHSLWLIARDSHYWPLVMSALVTASILHHWWDHREPFAISVTVIMNLSEDYSHYCGDHHGWLMIRHDRPAIVAWRVKKKHTLKWVKQRLTNMYTGHPWVQDNRQLLVTSLSASVNRQLIDCQTADIIGDNKLISEASWSIND